MTLKRVTWVAPDLNEWANPKKAGASTFYVNVAFDDNDSGSIGKQDRDKAMELHGLLTEAIGKELEFGLESTGKKNNNGGDKWKILSFPGYEPEPFVESSKATITSIGEVIGKPAANDAGIRAAVALKAAVELCAGVGNQDGAWVLSLADGFYDWLTARPGRTSPRGGNGDGPTAPVSSDPDTSPAADEAGHGDGSGGGTALPTSQSAPQEPTSPPSAAIATAANTPSGGPTSAAQTESLPAGEDSPETFGGRGDSGCPPHQLDKTVKPKPVNRYPCLKCGTWQRAS